MNTRYAWILIMMIALAAPACSKNQDEGKISNPEEKLLQVFTSELATIREYKNKSYADYLAYQNSIFKKRIKWTITLIENINKNYDSLTTDLKISYEEKWQHKFQPVIDDIDKEMRDLATRATTNLSEKEIARIEELQVQREKLEKSAPLVHLKPKFYQDR